MGREFEGMVNQICQMGFDAQQVTLNFLGVLLRAQYDIDVLHKVLSVFTHSYSPGGITGISLSWCAFLTL